MKACFLRDSLRSAFVFFALAGSLAWGQKPVIPTDGPLYLLLDSHFPGNLVVNDYSCNVQEGREWLARMAQTQGRQTPVIVVADRQVPLGEATEIVEMARRTHDVVYGVIKAYSMDEPVHFFTTERMDDIRPLIAYLVERSPARSGIFSSLEYSSAMADDPAATWAKPPRELVERLSLPSAK